MCLQLRGHRPARSKGVFERHHFRARAPAQRPSNFRYPEISWIHLVGRSAHGGDGDPASRDRGPTKLHRSSKLHHGAFRCVLDSVKLATELCCGSADRRHLSRRQRQARPPRACARIALGGCGHVSGLHSGMHARCQPRRAPPRARAGRRRPRVSPARQGGCCDARIARAAAAAAPCHRGAPAHGPRAPLAPAAATPAAAADGGSHFFAAVCGAPRRIPPRRRRRAAARLLAARRCGAHALRRGPPVGRDGAPARGVRPRARAGAPRRAGATPCRPGLLP